MTELVDLVSTPWSALALALLIFGFAPRLLLRVVVMAFEKGDPRRLEILGDLDAVEYATRPLFVAEQLEVALVEGMGGRAKWLWIRKVTARWSLTDGVQMNAEHPSSFWIPGPEEKDGLGAGDVVKLAFRTRDGWGERMWVRIERRTRRGFVGRLDNQPVGIPDLWADKRVKFRAEHVIDIYPENEELELDE